MIEWLDSIKKLIIIHIFKTLIQKVIFYILKNNNPFTNTNSKGFQTTNIKIKSFINLFNLHFTFLNSFYLTQCIIHSTRKILK